MFLTEQKQKNLQKKHCTKQSNENSWQKQAGRIPRPVMQRVIDFSSPFYGQMTAEQRVSQLVEGNVRLFGEEKRELILRIVTDMDNELEHYTVEQVSREVARQARVNLPIHNAKHQQNAYNQLSFTSVTRACMSSGCLDDVIECRNTKNGHAERLILRQLLQHGEIRGESFELVINNSPCVQCAKALAEWVTKTGNKLTIRFCNFYGKPEEFRQAAEILRKAGIKLHTYPLSNQHPEKITKKYAPRMESLDKRQKRRRIDTGFESDSESEMYEEPEQISAVTPAQALSRLERLLWEEEYGSRDIYAEGGFRYTPSHRYVRSGGQCFWDSLRRYSFRDKELRKAAEMTGLEVDRHVGYMDAFRLVENLGRIRNTFYALQIVEFYYGNPNAQGVRLEGQGYVLRLAYFHLPSEGDGHFVPPEYL